MKHNSFWFAETAATHADREFQETASVSPPIYQSSTFRSESVDEFVKAASLIQSDRFYSRYGNPTTTQTAAVIAALEGAEAALLTSSGMGAISCAVLSLVRQGDHIVAQQNHYAATTSLLRETLTRFGVKTTFVDQTQLSEFEKALRPETKLIVVESPSNPAMRLTDLQAVGAIARRRGIITLADNTFATPINQRPLDLGIDLVVHSATKYMGGHTDLLAGAIVGPSSLVNTIWETSLVLGSILGPFESWLLLRGLRTMPLRVKRQNQTALSLARFLEAHPKVEHVYYPGLESNPQHKLAQRQMSGFSGIFCLELKGGQSSAACFIESLKLAAHAPSVGGVETLVVQPVVMLARQISAEEYKKIGVRPDLIRISVGLEHEQDLIDDFAQALTNA